MKANLKNPSHWLSSHCDKLSNKRAVFKIRNGFRDKGTPLRLIYIKLSSQESMNQDKTHKYISLTIYSEFDMKHCKKWVAFV